ncbi:hypothetical protein [Rhizobium lusitanum]|jgi:hypothetical protein|uniref:Uncharacterized protein n=1 Tax=Rhizobium lusitanum TaxID=293958 RepID=A0A1C3XJ86_9HYPH|nr:hypothetical protein [Rhizobium lusitanum]SCB52352.1 hypothetical protein GA0061101_1493 [Rhizobium lusitanum]
MIGELSVVTTASFYKRKKRITAAIIGSLFDNVRAAHVTKSSRNIFKHLQVKAGNTRWSALCFKFSSAPSFLISTTTVREELCGYLLLVEYKGHLAVFSSRLGLTSAFKSEHLASVAMADVEAAVAKVDAVFQKVRLRNMSVSPFAMRSKTLEARDLTNVIGPSGSRRYAPQAFTVEHEGRSTSATPSTGRIGVRSNRVGHNDLIVFAESVIDELRTKTAAVSPFIKTFARPISIEEAMKVARPTTLSIDSSVILDAVTGDNPSFRLVRNNAGAFAELPETDLRALISSLEQTFQIVGRRKVREVRASKHGAKIGSISLNKSRIALRSLDLALAANVEVEDAAMALGLDVNRRSLKEFLDEANALVVLFNDVTLAYIGGTIFRDETLKDGGDDLLRYLHPEATLVKVIDEKGSFNPPQTAFDANSTFGVIVGTIGVADQILICDDLTDEWADFIGVRTQSGVTTVNFYHGKHGKLSLGASGFHVSVGQAIKNLGNMTFPPERMATKIASWLTNYNSNQGPSSIARIIHGTAATLEDELAQTRSNPNTIRRAVIVTSSLSKKAVEDALSKVKEGNAPKPAFVQLYWLLQSFFSACAEVGAVGSVVCQP